MLKVITAHCLVFFEGDQQIQAVMLIKTISSLQRTLVTFRPFCRLSHCKTP